MKVGLVGFQGSGKSSLFELLTGTPPDPAKMFTGQVETATIPDGRFDALVQLFHPKKEVPAKLELFDTPGLSQNAQENNAQRLGIIRDATALVHVIGLFAGVDVLKTVEQFTAELILADAQVISNRIERLRKDVTKPRPDKEQLQQELDAILPLADELDQGHSLQEFEFSDLQEKVTKSFSLLTRKKQLIVLNTSDSDLPTDLIEQLTKQGHVVIAGPVGLELEVMSLDAEDRDEFAQEMGLLNSCRDQLMQAIFQVTDLITFFTSGEKEVHAWLLKKGSNAVEAADVIHSDLARGFVRAEVMSVDDLIQLGSEREVKAEGLHHIEGKEYIVQDGDEIHIRSGV